MDEPSLHQLKAKASDGAVNATRTSGKDATSGPTSEAVMTGDRADKSTVMAPPLPGADIGLDRSNQVSSPKTPDDPAPASPALDASTPSNRAHVGADADIPIAATPRRPGSTNPHIIHASDENARSDSFATVLNEHTSSIHPEAVVADEPSMHQVDASASDGAVTATSGSDATASRTSEPVTTGDSTNQSQDPELFAQVSVVATADESVPNADITLDPRKQPFSSMAADDAAPASSAHVKASASNFAKVANPAHIDAEADVPIAAKPDEADSARSSIGRASDGTSSALSTESGDTDSMVSADPKFPQKSFANLTADATASSAQRPSTTQLDTVAQVAQRDRSTSSKQTSTQRTDMASLPNDSSPSVDAHPAAPAPEVAAIRLTSEVAPASETSRTVSITVQLANGQTAQASVREHAGTVDVKIVTPTSASAQRVSSEMDGMRQNLDAAGIKLGHSEISYQQGDGKGQGRERYRPPAQNQSASGKEVFIMDEVIQ